MDVFDLYAKLDLDSSGFENGLASAEDEASSFGSTLKGGLSKVKGFAGGMANVASVVGDYATKTASASDRIDKMSQKIGISREAFQKLDYVFSQNGASIDSLQMGMKTLSTQAESNSEVFDQLGISLTNTQGEAKTQEELFYEVVNALQGMEQGTLKTKLATQLLGRAGTELLPLLNQEQGTMDKLGKEAEELGLVLGDDVVDAGVDMTDSLDRCERAVGGLVNSLISKLLPGATDTLEGITKMLNGDFMGGFQQAGEGIVNIFSNALGIVDGIFGTSFQSWYDDCTKTFEGLGKGIYALFHGEEMQMNELMAKYESQEALDVKIRRKWEENVASGMSGQQALNEAKRSVLADNEMRVYFDKQYGEDFFDRMYSDVEKRAETYLANIVNAVPIFDPTEFYKSKYVPHLASGGIVSAPTMAVVGDNANASSDPEIVAPLSQLSSIMANAFRSVLGNSSQDIVLNVDGTELARATVNSINDLSRQTGVSLLA